MAHRTTSDYYGTVAMTLHWVSALLIVILLGLGFWAASMPASAAKETLLAFHAPLGILIVLITLARLIWWLFIERKPEPIQTVQAWQVTMSKWVHILFYVVILGMSASGIGMMILSGAGEVLFGSSSADLPDFANFLPRVPHGIGARFMIVLLAVHAGAALYHQFILKDGLLARMWSWRKMP